MALSKLKFHLRHKRWYGRAGKTPFAGLYRRSLPISKARCRDLRFLAVDCEMNGLNPARHQLLSIGWVAIESNSIIYHQRKHLLVHAKEGVGESIKFHGLSERDIAGAASVTRALTLLAKHAQNSILVFHHARLDIAFLQAAAMASFGCPMLLPYIDTMQIEHRRLNRRGKTGGLQLTLCRQRYGLPPTSLHNALNDAIATAELLLAQIAHIGNADKVAMSDIQSIAIG